MQWDKTTQTVLVAVTACLIVYDVIALKRSGFNGTISWQVYDNARKYPVIPFAFGVLMGHLFWTQLCI